MEEGFELVNVVRIVIVYGYCSIDIVVIYGNEVGVGEGFW